MKAPRGLDRCYPGLAAGERLRLDVAALARGEREHRLLIDSCAKERYTGCEHEFFDLVDLAHEFAICFATVEFAPRAASLFAFELALVAADELLLQATDGDDPAESGDMKGVERAEGFVVLLEQVVEALRAEGACVGRGFAAFCVGVLGVEAGDLLAAFAPTSETAFARLAAREADPAAVAEVRDLFAEVWRAGRERELGLRRRGGAR